MKFFVKFFVIIALLIGLMYEIGSPLLSRSAAAGAANDAASAGAQDYFAGGNLASATTAADAAAAVRGAKVTDVQVLGDGNIEVSVIRPAKSYVLHHISALKNWYNVKATATAGP